MSKHKFDPANSRALYNQHAPAASVPDRYELNSQDELSPPVDKGLADPVSEKPKEKVNKTIVENAEGGIAESKSPKAKKTTAKRPRPSSPIEQPAVNPNTKKRSYDLSGEGKPRNYKISVACNKALELCSKDRNVTRSAIFHEALVNEIDGSYYKLAGIYEEIQEKIKAGVPLEQLGDLRKQLGPIVTKTQQRNLIDGPTITICLMTSSADDCTLDFYSRESGIPRGLIVDQCLRAYLKDYLSIADELIAFFGIL